MIRNLGHALSVLVRHEVGEQILHDDIRAFHAPSECHDAVANGEPARRLLAIREAEAIAHRSFKRIMREAVARMGSPAALRRALMRAEVRAMLRRNPFLGGRS